MTWENDKNETATQIYSFIADFDEKIYANEERREDSLIQQAAHMQTAFSFVSAALFMVAAIIIDNRGRISLEFLLAITSECSLRSWIYFEINRSNPKKQTNTTSRETADVKYSERGVYSRSTTSSSYAKYSP